MRNGRAAAWLDGTGHGGWSPDRSVRWVRHGMRRRPPRSADAAGPGPIGRCREPAIDGCPAWHARGTSARSRPSAGHDTTRRLAGLLAIAALVAACSSSRPRAPRRPIAAARRPPRRAPSASAAIIPGPDEPISDVPGKPHVDPGPGGATLGHPEAGPARRPPGQPRVDRRVRRRPARRPDGVLDERRRAVQHPRPDRRRPGRRDVVHDHAARRARRRARSRASRSPSSRRRAIDLGDLEPGTYTVADGGGGTATDDLRGLLTAPAAELPAGPSDPHPADLCDDRAREPARPGRHRAARRRGGPRVSAPARSRSSEASSAPSAARALVILGLPLVIDDQLEGLEPAVRPFVVLVGAPGRGRRRRVDRLDARPAPDDRRSGPASWAPRTGSPARSSGVAQALLIVWLVGGLLAVGPIPRLTEAAQTSRAIRALNVVLPPPADFAVELGRLLDATGLPAVFVGFEPHPGRRRSTGPTTRRPRAIAKAALASTVKVSAAACGYTSSGTGFAVAARLRGHQRARRGRRRPRASIRVDDRRRQAARRRRPCCSTRSSTSPSCTSTASARAALRFAAKRPDPRRARARRSAIRAAAAA